MLVPKLWLLNKNKKLKGKLRFLIIIYFLFIHIKLLESKNIIFSEY